MSNVNFSIVHLVRTVYELTSSIIQTHYTRTTLVCLQLRKSFSIEDRSTLSPRTMHSVCCFRWCRCILSWTVIVWSDTVSEAKNRYWTSESPNGETRNQRDLSNQKRIVTYCEVDNKRSARLKTIKRQKPFSINTQKLKGMKEVFDINLKKQIWKVWVI